MMMVEIGWKKINMTDQKKQISDYHNVDQREENSSLMFLRFLLP